MKGREFNQVVFGATGGWPVGGGAQAGRRPRIGLPSPGRSVGADPTLATLNSVVTGLRELGYVEGQNIAIERGFGEANADRLREVVAELVGHGPDVIVALSTTAARPLKQATSVVPVVVVAMPDPVEDELVARLARPGGNVTGTTFLGPELVAKRLQLLSEVVPQHLRVAVLWHPHAYGDRTMAGMLKEAEQAAQVLGMQLQFFAAASPDDIEGTISLMTGADALSVFPSPILFASYGRIASIAADEKLPTIYAAREGAEAGTRAVWRRKRPYGTSKRQLACSACNCRCSRRTLLVRSRKRLHGTIGRGRTPFSLEALPS